MVGDCIPSVCEECHGKGHTGGFNCLECERKRHEFARQRLIEVAKARSECQSLLRKIGERLGKPSHFGERAWQVRLNQDDVEELCRLAGIGLPPGVVPVRADIYS